MSEITTPVCKLSIDSIDSADGNIGRLLLAAWDKGPSPAVLKSPSGFIEVNSGNNTNSKQTTPDENAKYTPEDTEQSSDKKESYSHIYSILESFNLMRLVCEENDKSGAEQSGNSNSDTTNNAKSDTAQDSKQSSVTVNTFTVKVGIKGVGYTEWKVAFRSNAIINDALNNVKKGKFKEARDIASKDLEVSGLVPLSAETYIEGNDVKKNVNPPFIGHCNFAMLAGADNDDTKGDSELAIAITPYLASTLKPNKSIIIKAVYEILDLNGLTGGLLGEVALDVKNAVKDQIVGNDSSSRWSGRDDNSGNVNADVADKLNEFLKKKFSKTSGNEERYQLYLSMAKFVQNALSKKYITFKVMAVNNNSAKNHNDLQSKIDGAVSNDLIWY